MPELPEVETTRRGVAPHLLDQRIERVIVRQPRLRWPVPDALQLLAGESIMRIERRAKYLLLTSRPGAVIVHLGMSGSLRLDPLSEPARKHDHVELQLASGLALRYHDPRRFGCWLWTAGDPAAHPLLAALGPEPLDDTFSGEYLFRQSRGRRVAVKPFLMSNPVVVGVGNIYATEALFMTGIRPGKAAGRLTRAQCDALVESIKQVLAAAIEMGGTTLRDFLHSDGQPGYFAQSLNVYGRAGESCKRCGETIRTKILGQRASAYCPGCQH
jgi:formamidopyrimidine-DNA glycosylase